SLLTETEDAGSSSSEENLLPPMKLISPTESYLAPAPIPEQWDANTADLGLKLPPVYFKDLVSSFSREDSDNKNADMKFFMGIFHQHDLLNEENEEKEGRTTHRRRRRRYSQDTED